MAGELTTALHMNEQLVQIHEHLAEQREGLATVTNELRQRPTKFQIVLGALSVVFVLVTPAAIVLTSIIDRLD